MASGRPMKRRRLTPPTDERSFPETIQASELLKHAANWDLEQDYERQARRQPKTKESTRLPIKTAQGNLQEVERDTDIEDDSDSFLASGSDNGENDRDETPPTDSVDEPQITLRQQIVQSKEELARLAALLNEDPEENLGCFKKLSELGGQSRHPTIQRIVIAAQAAIYKDVIPGYRIRPYTDEELTSKISKDIRKTRLYENNLVTSYRIYIERLVSLMKDRSYTEELSLLRQTATNCICSLVLAVPHFNFRTELLNAIVHELSSLKPTTEFFKCVKTLESFFEADEDGAASLEAVRILTKSMKAKDYKVREEVVSTFFHLRLLSELSPPGSANQDGVANEKIKLRGKRIKREQSQHLSKRERKMARDRKAVEKDMKEADAIVSHEEREKMQSETLKLVFATYFRILKAKIPTLMGVVLEGLAKYAHLINQDYFGDILEALKDIVNQASMADEVQPGQDDTDMDNSVNEVPTRDTTRESLLSIQTAFTLFSEQEVAKSAASLHLDLSFFASHIFKSLYLLTLDPDIELGPRSLHLPDPHSQKPILINNKVNVSTPALLIVRVLTSILLTASQKPPTVRVASFYKRLLTASLQVPEKSALAILELLDKVAEKFGRNIEPLWYTDARKGDGVYRGDSDLVDGTNVFAVGSGVWEGEILRHHYCPAVRDRVRGIDKIIAGLGK